jgi:hypothetical protein
MIRFFRFACMFISIALLATGYFIKDLAWPAVGILAFGLFWGLGLVLRWDWILIPALYISFGIAAYGLILGISSALFISAAIFSLLAWDLAEFLVRLRRASPEDDTVLLEKQHLSRLAAPALIGFALSVYALTIHVQPLFEGLVILMFFMVWGIGRVVNWLLSKA